MKTKPHIAIQLLNSYLVSHQTDAKRNLKYSKDTSLSKKLRAKHIQCHSEHKLKIKKYRQAIRILKKHLPTV